MIESGMNYAIALCGAALQAGEVFDVTAKGLGTECSQGLSALVRAGQAEYLMAATDQFLGHLRTDKACGTGKKYAHGSILRLLEGQLALRLYPVKAVSLSGYKN
jgi:hypothetical protein